MAKAEVTRYLNSHHDELDIQLREDPADPNNVGLESTNRKRFSYNSNSPNGPVYITIAFSEEVHESSTAQDLQRTLTYVALDELPLPGFMYPDGWTIYPRTPVSSFKDGVTIVSYQNGRLHFKVDTTFFDVYGVKSNLDLPADSSTPADAYFRVVRDIRGRVDVNMPLVFV